MIDSNNFIQVALRSYNNIQCKTIEQFEEDLGKFSLVKKLLNNNKFDREYIQLCLNTIMSILNVFDNVMVIEMLFFKVRKENWDKLKSYLIFLNRMPEKIEFSNTNNSDIKICQEIAKELRMI